MARMGQLGTRMERNDLT